MTPIRDLFYNGPKGRVSLSNHRISYIAITRVCACFCMSVICAAYLAPANAAARASLPIVNIGAGAVSARALFGDTGTINQTSETLANYDAPSADNNNAVTVAPYRAPAKKPSVIARTAAAARDILSPKKPSNDIWAQNAAHAAMDAPLRAPRANEFAILGDDFELPEESLDGGQRPMAGSQPLVASRQPSTASRQPPAANRQPSGYADDIFGAAPAPTVTAIIAPTAPRATQNYDSKLATLTENYKKLEAKLASLERGNTENAGANNYLFPQGNNPTDKIASRNAAGRGSVGEIVGRIRVPDDAEITNNKSQGTNYLTNDQRPMTNGVAIRQMVVPMDDNADDNARFAKSDVKERPLTNNQRPTANDNFAYKDETPLTKLSPMQLKKAFQKTYLSENKHLSTYQIDDGFDVSSKVAMAGFDSSADLSEEGGIRPLEIKIGFRADDAALSRDNYNLLSEYASTVVANPKRAIQISIPERATRSYDDRKMAARRLAIVEQVLRDSGVSEQRIMPVLSQRADDSFVLRVISSDQFETLTSSQRDMFGDTVSSKSYKSMKW